MNWGRLLRSMGYVNILFAGVWFYLGSISFMARNELATFGFVLLMVFNLVLGMIAIEFGFDIEKDIIDKLVGEKLK